MPYLLALLLAASLYSTLSFASTPTSCNNNTDCIEVGRWDIGIALGYGNKTNPLKDYEDIPLYAVPTLAYYGDNWFFDNGNIGYTLSEGENYTVNLITTFSNDSAFFHRWDPSNIFLLSGDSNHNAVTPLASTMTTRTAKDPKAIGELENRNFTYLGGVEAFIYTRFGIVHATVAHDILNVHGGTESKLKWFYNLPLNKWNFEIAAVLDWKSEEVVDYYYGVRANESLYWNQAYQAESAVNKSIEFTGQYVLTDHWNLLFVARYTDIANEIADSPLLDKDYTSTYFVSAAYRF